MTNKKFLCHLGAGWRPREILLHFFAVSSCTGLLYGHPFIVSHPIQPPHIWGSVQEEGLHFMYQTLSECYITRVHCKDLVIPSCPGIPVESPSSPGLWGPQSALHEFVKAAPCSEPCRAALGSPCLPGHLQGRAVLVGPIQHGHHLPLANSPTSTSPGQPYGLGSSQKSSGDCSSQTGPG